MTLLYATPTTAGTSSAALAGNSSPLAVSAPAPSQDQAPPPAADVGWPEPPTSCPSGCITVAARRSLPPRPPARQRTACVLIVIARNGRCPSPCVAPRDHPDE